MAKKDIHKPITLKDLGEFTEDVLLPAVERIVDRKLDEKLEEKFQDFEGRMGNKFVTKDYLDKKLFELEERVVNRLLKEKKDVKDAIVLLISIIRKNRKPTTKEMETLVFLEQKLSTA